MKPSRVHLHKSKEKKKLQREAKFLPATVQKRKKQIHCNVKPIRVHLHKTKKKANKLQRAVKERKKSICFFTSKLEKKQLNYGENE